MYLTQSLHKNFRQQPDSIAVISGEQQWTYREFTTRVQKLAGALQKLGLAEGERVALLSLNSARYLEYVFALPWAGGAINPVNTRWSASEVAYSLDDSETQFLIVDDNFVDFIADIKAKSTALKTVIYAGDKATPEGMLSYETLIDEAEAVDDALRNNDDLAGIFYTGGTTGFPKGVMLSHKNLITSTTALIAANVFERNCRFLHAAPMFHLADFAMMLAVFMQGGTHVVIPGFEPTAVLSNIQQHKTSHTLLVPTMVQMLLDSPNFNDFDISSHKRIIYGASPMPLATLTNAMEKMPNIGFVQAYGMTELSPAATISGIENHTPEAVESGRVRSAGLAGLLQEVKIVDEDGNEVDRHTVGEVIVRGPNVMLGYWNKPEATAEAIVDGWMHTGDGGYMDEDGYIFIVDRVKDMIISGGENIYSAEVESAISQHPAVAQCAVIGIPSPEWGEAVHAVIIPKPGNTITNDELRAHCKTLIAGYKSPRSLELVESLPLSGAGKILKTELRKPYWADQASNVS